MFPDRWKQEPYKSHFAWYVDKDCNTILANFCVWLSSPDPSLIPSLSKPIPSHSEPTHHDHGQPLTSSSGSIQAESVHTDSKFIPPSGLSLPSPHHGRKSVLSFKVPPVSSSLQHRQATLSQETMPLAGLKRSSPGREDPSSIFSFTSPKRHSKKTWLDEFENAEPSAKGDESTQLPKWFWERTFMEGGDDEVKEEEDANCKQQWN